MRHELYRALYLKILLHCLFIVCIISWPHSIPMSAYNSSPIYPRLNHIHIHFEHCWMTLAPTRIRSGSRRKSVSSALPVGTGLWRASHCYEPGDHGWPTNIYRYTRLLPRHSREKATSTRLEYLPGRRVNPYWLRSLANARHCTAPRYGGTPRSPCLVSSPKYHDGSLLYPPPSGSPSIRQNFLSPEMVFNLGDCSRHPGSSTVLLMIRCPIPRYAGLETSNWRYVVCPLSSRRLAL